MSKSSRYGKYGGADYGTFHELDEKTSGTSHKLIGANTDEYSFRDKATGAIRWIPAKDYETARRIAEAHGWVRYVQRGTKGVRKTGSK